MKKHISRTALPVCLLLVCMIVVGLFSSCKKEEAAFTMQGVQLSVDDFKSFYSGEAADVNACASKKDAQIGVSNFNHEDNYLSFYLMASADKNYNLGNFLGQVLADETARKNGINATVGYLSDLSNNFSVLLFQIYNDDAPDDQLLFHPELSGKPHLKVYLIDSSHNMYFFESELPAVFSDFTTEGLDAVSAYDKWYETFYSTGTETEG